MNVIAKVPLYPVVIRGQPVKTNHAAPTHHRRGFVHRNGGFAAHSAAVRALGRARRVAGHTIDVPQEAACSLLSGN